MTVEVQQGQSTTLSFELRNRDGDLADADTDTLELAVRTVPEDTVVSGFPVAQAGLTHSGTGLYGYLWTVPEAQATGTYLARWDGSVEGEQIETAEESVFVVPEELSDDLTYASVAALRDTLPDVPPDDRDDYLLALLVAATDIITKRCGRDFFRHPAVPGTEARYFDTDGSGLLIVPEGIVSLTSVEYSTTTGGTLTALVAADWNLEPTSTRTGFPYWSLRLSGSGSLTSWIGGRRLARLTGVFGWETVPTIIERGTIALAREMYVMQLHHLSEPNPNPWAAVPELLPRPTYEAINWGSRLMGFLFI